MLREYDGMKKEIKKLSTSTVYQKFKSIYKKTENKKSKSCEDKKGNIMLSSNCVMCDSKKLRFIKEQEDY